MLVDRFSDFASGWLLIKVTGRNGYKFINACIRRDIKLIEINSCEQCSFTAKTSIQGFYNMKEVARKARCRVKILKKNGLPFIIRKYRKRLILSAGLPVFLAVILIANSYVWNIEIIGINNIPQNAITEILNQNGIMKGAKIKNLDLLKASYQMTVQIDEIAWNVVRTKGTKIIVEVAERRMPPEIVPPEYPCNIVAAKDSVILILDVKAGSSVVKPGETVKKGQILVSGRIQSVRPELQERQVHALAKIKGRTWYEGKSNVINVIQQTILTGNYKKRYTLELFNHKYILNSPKAGFENEEITQHAIKPHIGSFFFPFQLHIDIINECSIIDVNISTDEARDIATKKALDIAAGQAPEGTEPGKILVRFDKNPEGIETAVVTLEYIEELGIPVRIGGT